MKKVANEIFAPLIEYKNSWKLAIKESEFAKKVELGEYDMGHLTKITLAALVLSTLIEQISQSIFNDDLLLFSLIPYPILNELIFVMVFYFFGLINTLILKSSLKTEKKIDNLFSKVFLIVTSVTMLFMPLSFLIDLLLRLVLGDEIYLPNSNSTTYGYVFGQIALMAGPISSLYGVEKKKVMRRLSIAVLIVGLISIGIMLALIF